MTNSKRNQFISIDTPLCTRDEERFHYNDVHISNLIRQWECFSSFCINSEFIELIHCFPIETETLRIICFSLQHNHNNFIFYQIKNTVSFPFWAIRIYSFMKLVYLLKTGIILETNFWDEMRVLSVIYFSE